MRPALLSAAMLLSSGCDSGPGDRTGSGDPLRHASFRSHAAADRLASCPGASRRPESRFQTRRFEELKGLAARKGAGQAIWLGANDWAAVERYDDRPPCAAGPGPWRASLAQFDHSLDRLAAAIAEHEAVAR